MDFYNICKVYDKFLIVLGKMKIKFRTVHISRLPLKATKSSLFYYVTTFRKVSTDSRLEFELLLPIPFYALLTISTTLVPWKEVHANKLLWAYNRQLLSNSQLTHSPEHLSVFVISVSFRLVSQRHPNEQQWSQMPRVVSICQLCAFIRRQRPKVGLPV